MADHSKDKDTDSKTGSGKTAKPRSRRTSRGGRGSRSAKPAPAHAEIPREAPPQRAPEPEPPAPVREVMEDRPPPPAPPPRESEAPRDETRAPDSDRRGGEDRDRDRDGPAESARGEGGAPESDGTSAGPQQPGPQHRPQHGGGQRENWGGGGGGGGDWGFRKKFKKDKFKNKFFHQGGGGGGGGGGPAPRWRQPPPLAETSPLGTLPDPMKFVNLDELRTRAGEIAKGGDPLFLDDVAKMTLAELVNASRQREVPVIDNPGRTQLINGLIKWAGDNQRPLIDRGHLDLADEGHGFVVHSSANYRLLPESTYVAASFIRKFGLRRGLQLDVQVQPPAENERCPSTLIIQTVMGGAPDDAAKVTPFEELVPYYPTKRIFLEVPTTDVPTKVDVSMRCVDILTPIGFGQRGLIVAPPRTGKTILLQGLANSVATNYPEARLIVLLVDERPEEVTDFRRNTRGEVVSSTFDESPESHIHAAEMVGEKARRLVERGEHVVILLDSITRLGRAYNALAGNSGKIMSGGIEATALQKPKRFFGAARNIEGGGSLTIMASALIDTNSRMDEVIFEEFKGTGNMELHLDRDLVNKRIFPALNFERSGTRKEELLYHPDELQKIYSLRRIMLGVPAYEAMEMLIQRLKKTRSNAEFLLSLTR